MTVSARYTTTAIVLHWAIAVLITCNVVLALSADNLPDAWVRPVIDTHKSIGITVLGLALMRLLWRLTHRPPPLPPSLKPWERTGAHAAHIILYVLIFAMPLTGWMHDSAWKAAATHPMFLFGVIPWPRLWFLTAIDPAQKDYWHSLLGQVHTACAYVLYAMVTVHVAGALKHQFIDREPELQRMLP